MPPKGSRAGGSGNTSDIFVVNGFHFKKSKTSWTIANNLLNGGVRIAALAKPLAATKEHTSTSQTDSEQPTVSETDGGALHGITATNKMGRTFGKVTLVEKAAVRPLLHCNGAESFPAGTKATVANSFVVRHAAVEKAVADLMSVATVRTKRKSGDERPFACIFTRVIEAATLRTAGAGVAVTQPLVPKVVEDQYLQKRKASQEACINSKRNCEAHSMCRFKNVAAFNLPAFSPPIDGMQGEQRCVLCIRRDATVHVAEARFDHAPLDPRFFPYRNAIGHEREHPIEVCVAFDVQDHGNGCAFYFVEHNPDYYTISGKNAFVQGFA